MQYPAWRAGQRVTGSLLRAMMFDTILQGSDQTVTNSTTYLDSDLQFTVAANAIYLVLLRAAYSSGGSGTGGPDIKFNWRVPSGAFLQRYTLGLQQDTTSAINSGVVMARRSGTDGAVGGTSLSDFIDYQEDVLLRTGVGGAVAVRFAQRAAVASDTILRADSYVQYKRIA